MMLRWIFAANDLDKGKFPHPIHQIFHEKHLTFLKRLHAESINVFESFSGSAYIPAASWVPASNFSGTGAQTASVSETLSIISPPVRNGGMLSSNSCFPPKNADTERPKYLMA